MISVLERCASLGPWQRTFQPTTSAIFPTTFSVDTLIQHLNQNLVLKELLCN